MSVASKNPFDLLGNDDGDSDTPAGPAKSADKNSTRTGKRNEPAVPTRGSAAPTGRTRGSYSGNEAAFRDRNVGSDRNRVKATDESPRGARGGYGARVRGGRGARFSRDKDDRHTKGLPSGSDKQAAHSWGATEGDAELKDEQAGEEIATKEQKDAATAAAATTEAEAEPNKEDEESAELEDKQISYADYLAQQAEKKMSLESSTHVRQPNEGTKPDKKWANAKALVKDDEVEFMTGSAGKAKRERERKTKQLVEIDNRYIEPERTRGGRGGRGGGRGGRGDRGDRGDRGGHDRGEGRGGRGGGLGRGGGRGRGEAAINTSDQQAFPELGK